MARRDVALSGSKTARLKTMVISGDPAVLAGRLEGLAGDRR